MTTNRNTAILIAVPFVLMATGCGLAGDGGLERNFYSHRNELESVLQMFSNDQGFFEVTTRFTQPNKPIGSQGGMSEDRFRQYRSYLTEIGIQGVVRRDDGVILFTADTTGILTKGRYKGYAYAPAKPTRTYDQLDHPSDDTFLNCSPHYKPLQDHWYLYVLNCIE